MGAEITGQNGQPDNRTEAGTERKTSDRTSSTSSSSGGTRGGESGRSGGTATETKEKVSGLAVVEIPVVPTDEQERKRLERNAKRRARYKEQKEASGGSVKPRKVNNKKPETKVMDNTQINMMILSVSALIASRPNCEQWLLTEAEVNSITTPLMSMLAESEALSVINENSNQIALVFACITVFAPRIIVTVQKMKEEKARERVAKQQTAEAEAKHKNTDRRNDVKPPTTSAGNGDGLSIFGSPTG